MRNLMSAERMVQYVKEGTEAFDDLFPVGERRLASGRAFEHMLNWLSAFMFMHNFVFEDGDPEEDGGPRWSEKRRRCHPG